MQSLIGPELTAASPGDAGLSRVLQVGQRLAGGTPPDQRRPSHGPARRPSLAGNCFGQTPSQKAFLKGTDFCL